MTIARHVISVMQKSYNKRTERFSCEVKIIFDSKELCKIIQTRTASQNGDWRDRDFRTECEKIVSRVATAVRHAYETNYETLSRSNID